MKKILFFLLPLAACPLFAQQPPAEEAGPRVAITNTSVEAAPAKAPMPADLASAALSVHVGTQRRAYEETVGKFFLNKTFVSRTMPDGSQRTYHYKAGFLEDAFYVLPVEIRTSGRLQILLKYYFRTGADPALVRWEEVNYITRQVTKHSSFPDVLQGVSFFQSLLPKPVDPPPAAAPAEETPQA